MAETQFAAQDTRLHSDESQAKTITEQMFDKAARHAAASQGVHTASCCSLASTKRKKLIGNVCVGAAGGAGGSTTFAALQGADAAWAKAKAMKVGNHNTLDCFSIRVRD